MTILVVAFVASGLAVVPSLQEANANEMNLLKNEKDKKPKKHRSDFTIDEPVIELVKDIKKPKKNRS